MRKSYTTLIGTRVGCLTVLGRTPNDNPRYPMMMCTCDCGRTFNIYASNLRQSPPSGCKNCRVRAAKTHGLTGTSTYRSWKAMIQRCTNPKTPRYYNYGGKGIKVCVRWTAFEEFLADMGTRPDGTSLDRIDNTQGYSPPNCRWSDIKTQNRNTNQNVRIRIGDVVLCLTEWCERLNKDRTKVRNRFRNLGWTIAEALETPNAEII